MRVATLLIVSSLVLQLVSIWNHGPAGHSLGGWISLTCGILIIADRCHKVKDYAGSVSFAFQSALCIMIIVSLIILRML